MTEITQYLPASSKAATFKEYVATVLWPILGLAIAGLLTLAWCGFLLWLFSRF